MKIPVDVTVTFDKKEYTLNEFVEVVHNLKSENEALRKCLEFYADENNWNYQSDKPSYDDASNPQDVKYYDPLIKEDLGTKAKEVLEKYPRSKSE